MLDGLRFIIQQRMNKDLFLGRKTTEPLDEGMHTFPFHFPCYADVTVFFNSELHHKQVSQTTLSYLLVKVRVEGNLLHVLGLAKFHERLPSGVVGVEHLGNNSTAATHERGEIHWQSCCQLTNNVFLGHQPLKKKKKLQAAAISLNSRLPVHVLHSVARSGREGAKTMMSTPSRNHLLKDVKHKVGGLVELVVVLQVSLFHLLLRGQLAGLPNAVNDCFGGHAAGLRGEVDPLSGALGYVPRGIPNKCHAANNTPRAVVLGDRVCLNLDDLAALDLFTRALPDCVLHT